MLYFGLISDRKVARIVQRALGYFSPRFTNCYHFTTFATPSHISCRSLSCALSIYPSISLWSCSLLNRIYLFAFIFYFDVQMVPDLANEGLFKQAPVTYAVAQSDVPGLSCIFSALVLELSISSKSLWFFCQRNAELEPVQIVVIFKGEGIQKLRSGCYMFSLLLGPMRGQN